MPNLATIATTAATIGLLGGWTAARRQRGLPSSERLLDVAEAYVIVLRAASQCVLYPHDREPRFAECRRLQGELWVLIARIELLYGPESKVAVHAIEATGALAAVEVLARRDARNEGDLSLRHRIEAEEGRVEREYKAFLQAARAVIRARRRRPAGMASELACEQSRHRRRVPNADEAGTPRPEHPRLDELLRDLDEFLGDVEQPQPITGQDAAPEDRDAGAP